MKRRYFWAHERVASPKNSDLGPISLSQNMILTVHSRLWTLKHSLFCQNKALLHLCDDLDLPFNDESMTPSMNIISNQNEIALFLVSGFQNESTHRREAR